MCANEQTLDDEARIVSASTRAYRYPEIMDEKLGYGSSRRLFSSRDWSPSIRKCKDIR